ncbi:MAG: PASTA domain-containing protein, partial [Mycolicibacterium aromaticivorans]|nr:PASTA domain-containing protein [Mycolicibacterium aromaticivorans]
GCVLYEVLTGEPPFIGDSPVAVAYQHVREDPVPPSQKHSGISPELDAVVLKALAKNPDNRYQTAAEMRTDLVRVHNGEAPEAPKVLSAAERTSLLNTTVPSRGDNTDEIPRHGALVENDRAGGSIGRWLIVVAVLAILTVVVTIGINMVSGNPRNVQIPDVRGQSQADAIAALQNKGFKIRTLQKTDNTIPPQKVIGTDPAANTMVAAGDDITINVSSGPEQQVVPDCTGLSYTDCAKKLDDAGFSKHKQVLGTSTPEQRDKVVQTIPPANQHATITAEISVVVGTGPESAIIPDVKDQTVPVATQILNGARFQSLLTVDTDSPLPQGQVVGTNPPAGQT